MRYLIAVISIVLFTVAAHADERVFTWVDKDGTVHYSDKPTGTRVTPMIVSPPLANEQNKNRLEEQGVENVKRAEEKGKTGEELAQIKEQRELRERNCKKVRDRLATLTSGQRLRMKKKDGTCISPILNKKGRIAKSPLIALYYTAISDRDKTYQR